MRKLFLILAASTASALASAQVPPSEPSPSGPEASAYEPSARSGPPHRGAARDRARAAGTGGGGSPFSPRRAAPAPTPLPPPAPVAESAPQPPVLPSGAEAAPLLPPPPVPSVQTVSLGGAGSGGRTFIGIVGEKALYRTSEGQYVFESFQIK